jgi:uncharacterized protein HemX
MGIFIGNWERKDTLICLALALCLVTVLWLGHRSEIPPVNTQQAITSLRLQLEAQHKRAMEAKEAQRKDLASRLSVSDQKYKYLSKKVQEIQNASANIKPPQGQVELRDRFAAVGFPPLPGQPPGR